METNYLTLKTKLSWCKFLQIYIVGGFNGQEVLRSAEVYDPSINQWSFITSMNEARSGVSLVAYNGYLYALGGFDGFERLPTCEQYLPSEGEWQHTAVMINPRSNFAAVILDQMIFVIGGFNGKLIELWKSSIRNCRYKSFLYKNVWKNTLEKIYFKI